MLHVIATPAASLAASSCAQLIVTIEYTNVNPLQMGFVGLDGWLVGNAIGYCFVLYCPLQIKLNTALSAEIEACPLQIKLNTALSAGIEADYKKEKDTKANPTPTIILSMVTATNMYPFVNCLFWVVGGWYSQIYIFHFNPQGIIGR